MTNLIRSLGSKLPGWTFNAYGNGEAIACYPPKPLSVETWTELSFVAPVRSVCGPLYVVTGLN